MAYTKQIFKFVAGSTMLLLCVGISHAAIQTSDSYQLERSVIPAGGGESNSDSHRLNQVIGQGMPVGAGFGDTHDQYAGFFGAGISALTPPVQIAAGTSQGQFAMVGFSRYPQIPSCEAVFGINYNTNFHRIGSYDPVNGPAANNWYVECGSGLEIRPGRAYWVLAREGLTTSYRGTMVSLEGSFDVALRFNPTTVNGWNQVAPPTDRDYTWDQLQVVTGSGIGPVADFAGHINPVIYEWTGNMNQPYIGHDIATEGSFVLEAGKGYWVEARQAGVALRFPAVVTGAFQGEKHWLAATWSRTKSWLQRKVFYSSTAVADSGGPPMPPGGFSTYYAGADRVDAAGGGGGCFIETAAAGVGVIKPWSLLVLGLGLGCISVANYLNKRK